MFVTTLSPEITMVFMVKLSCHFGKLASYYKQSLTITKTYSAFQSPSTFIVIENQVVLF